MKDNEFNIEDEQKRLVLARFKTLNPDLKILLGGSEELTVKELMRHIEAGDELGKNIVKVQMRMLKVLTSPS